MSLAEPSSVRPTLVTYVGLMLLVLVPLGMALRPFAVSVGTGAILAVLCYPLYARLRRHLPPWMAGLVVTLAAVLLILVPVILLLVGAVQQAAVGLGQLSNTDTPTIAEIVATVRRWLPITDLFGTPDELGVRLKDGLAAASGSVSGWVIRQAQTIPETVLHLVIVVLSTHFLLVDGRRLYSWIGEKLPLSRQIRMQLVGSFRSATNAVVLASVAAASAQSVLLLIGFWALGVPAPLLATGATFVLAWVPPIGTLPVWGSAAAYLYVQGSPGRAATMVALGLVVGVVDNVVKPLVLRGREAMHPMVSLLAILGGLALLGVPGVFIGPLLASLAIAMLEIWPAVATHCGIAVSGAGVQVPEVALPVRVVS